MVSQAKGGCKECGSMAHTKSWHTRTPIKRTVIRPVYKSVTNGVIALIEEGKVSVRLPRKKRTDRAIAKDKAWDAFSIYIRTRDCLRFTGNPKVGMCVTCKKKYMIYELQAGHFVAGRGNAVLFNEQIVYSQCGYCNQKPPMGLGGNYAAYTLFMFDEGYSRNDIEGFLALKGTIKQYKTNDFIQIYNEYQEKTKALLANR